MSFESGRAGGIVVSMLAIYSDDHSSNHAGYLFIIFSTAHGKRKNKFQKMLGLARFLILRIKILKGKIMDLIL